MRPVHVSLGLSKKKKLPVWKLFDSTFAPWDLSKAFEKARKARNAGISEGSDGYYHVKISSWDLKLTGYYAGLIVNEFALWEYQYLPVDVKGKVILDIGAGEGESAVLYLSHGAEKVTAIEPNPVAFKVLEENVKANDLPIVAINEKFDLKHLQIDHDFLKMDIEGHEVSLLDLPADYDLGQCAIEGHPLNGRFVGHEIAKKFGLEIVEDDGKGVVILNSRKREEGVQRASDSLPR